MLAQSRFSARTGSGPLRTPVGQAYLQIYSGAFRSQPPVFKSKTCQMDAPGAKFTPPPENNGNNNSKNNTGPYSGCDNGSDNRCDNDGSGSVSHNVLVGSEGSVNASDTISDDKLDPPAYPPGTRVPLPPPLSISQTRELAFVALICLCQIITQAGVAQTINCPTEIGRTFGVENDPGKLSWFSASYSLTLGTFILVAGRLGDLYGYKLIFITGNVFMGVWSLVVGFSGFTTSDVFFNVARALQGIGPAFCMPNAAALVGHYFPPGKKKMRYLAAFGAVAPGGFVLGALFSAIFTQLVWWPWLFWVGGMVSLAMAVLLYVIIPKHIGNREAGSFDWAGAVTGVCGLVLINFAWNQGPNVGWDKPYVYVLLILGFASMGAFVWSSNKVSEPLVPPECLKGETGFVLGCIAAGWSCFGVWLYYCFRWQEYVDGWNPIIRAVHFIPAPFAGVAAAGLTILLLRKVSVATVMLISMLFFFTGIVLMGTRPKGQTYWTQLFFSTMIQSFGMDISFPAGTMILSAAFPKHQQGLAGSLVSTFVNYSVSIGLGIAGTVEYYTTLGMPEGEEKRIKGMKNAFYMGMGLAGVGVVLGTIFVVLDWRKTHAADREKREKSETVPV